MGNFFSDPKQDFTTTQYVELLRLAQKNYRFVGYQDIVAGEKFVLWRHDCDYSLNRALRLAQLENEESLKSTFFLNPHSELYNLIEKGQSQLVEKILMLGHDIGLHFDAAYYDIRSERQLDALVAREAGWLNTWFGIEPTVFSFHNPTEFLLTCERESYGGLINCYSRMFKTTVPYCSDSNGYWRFRRLSDVLESAKEPCLQVLTHPEWWQETSMMARERIFRCIDGRASSVMNDYDALLKVHGRINQQNLALEFQILKEVFGKKAELLDFRWMRGEYASVFVELWSMLEARLAKICRIQFRRQIHAGSVEVNSVLQSSILCMPVYKIAAVLYGRGWSDIAGVDEADFMAWRAIRDHLVHGLKNYSKIKLESGIIFLTGVIRRFLEFEKKHPLIEVRPGIGKMQRSNAIDGACRAWLIQNCNELGIGNEALNTFAADYDLKNKI
jgi:hypothetical protein